MHPILKDGSTLALYLLVWIVLGLMCATLLAVPGKAPWSIALAFSLPMMLVYAFMSLSAWYICRAFPLEKTPVATLLTTLALASFLSSTLWSLVGLGWATALETLLPESVPRTWYKGEVPMVGATGVVLFLLAAAVTYLLATFELSRAAERRTLELKVLARDAELRALRAQIDPHFLYNSLNSISALTATNPAAAREMTVKLADFLRMSMDYGACESITFSQELTLTSRFLEIEKVRFGERLVIETAVDETTHQCRIAPLLLQPLVENAVNHGIAHLLGGGTIRLTARRMGSLLNITIENPVEPFRPKKPGTGVGVENVRQRLRRLYGSEGRVDVDENQQRFIASMSFPWEERAIPSPHALQ